MKSKIIIVALAIALVALSAKLVVAAAATSPADHDGKQPDSTIVYNNIMTRVSVRAYDTTQVEQSKVEKMLRAGMAAPSAMDKRPWHFIVVNNKDILAEIAKITPNARMADGAPLAIIVCGDLTKEDNDWKRDYWIQDVAAASQNILLEAHALGLGAVWTGTYPSTQRVAAIKEFMELPETMVPFSVIVIGYPAEKPQPKDKWDEKNVSYNLYGGKLGEKFDLDEE